MVDIKNQERKTSDGHKKPADGHKKPRMCSEILKLDIFTQGRWTHPDALNKKTMEIFSRVR